LTEEKTMHTARPVPKYTLEELQLSYELSIAQAVNILHKFGSEITLNLHWIFPQFRYFGTPKKKARQRRAVLLV
jgi:hypothetical protein